MRRVLGNVIILGMGQVVTLLLGLAYTVISTHYLGPTKFGELTFALALCAVFAIIINFGTNPYITRTVAREPERVNSIVSAAIALRFALLIPSLLVLYAYVYLAHLGPEPALLVYILSLGQSPQIVVSVLLAVFQGREKMSLIAAGVFAESSLSLLLAVVIVWLHGTVIDFALIYFATSILLVMLNIYWLSRFARLTWRIPWSDVRDLLLGGTAFLATDVFLTVYTYMSAMLLGLLAGSTAVGFYVPANRLFGAALFVPTIVGQASLPLLSRLGLDRSGHDFARAGRKVLGLLLVCGIPLTIGLISFAGPLILAVFGPAYRPSIPVLMLLSLCIVPMFLNIQLAELCTACDRQWMWTVAIIGGSGANILMTVASIPAAAHYWHNAALGAAIALLVAEVAQLLYGAGILRDVLFRRELVRVVAAALGAGAVQACVLWATSGLWPLASEALAGSLYVALAVLLGAIPRNDAMFFLDAVVTRVSSTIGRARRNPFSAPEERIA